MFIGRFICGILSLTTAACFAAAPQREPLSDASWTGPMLAPNAAIPKGHVPIEPYLYDVITQGFYDSTGARHSAPHVNGFGSLTYINYGVFNKFPPRLIPTFGYNEVSQGLNSAGAGMGDLTVQAQYRLKQFQQGGWLPTASINVQETFPTGKHDHLGDRASNGFGAGAYTTTLSLFTQTYLWMPTGRILRLRFNLSQAFSDTVNVADVSLYGTSPGISRARHPWQQFSCRLSRRIQSHPALGLCARCRLPPLVQHSRQRILPLQSHQSGLSQLRNQSGVGPGSRRRIQLDQQTRLPPGNSPVSRRPQYHLQHHSRDRGQLRPLMLVYLDCRTGVSS